MVGLSDIPFVGIALDRLSNATIDAGYRGLRYILCYKSLVNNLTSEVENVKVQEARVSRKIEEETNSGKTIQDHVIDWQKQVEEIKTLPEELSRQRPSWSCFNVVVFPNPVTRFRLGRKAAHKAKYAAELTASGVDLLKYEIADLPADPNLPVSDTKYQKFQSRDEAYGKLWEALVKVDGPPIIGIYGMPGVGKTRMMEKAWEHAKDEKIFEKVTRANVGNGKVDVIKLQNQLAGYLGCHFVSQDNEGHRASQLNRSLINAGKTLVILDDVWEEIHLEKIGIPHGDHIPKGCKILLTSRDKNVCLRSGCIDPIQIHILTVDEAWDMFKNTVGTSKIDSLRDTSLAKQVCDECGRLPLLIHAVGNAIKVVSKNSWNHALSQLQDCMFDEVEQIDPKVYTCIQWSFDKLKNDAKRCLLLCSLFAEDADIEVKMLGDFAMGSQLLSSRRNVEGVVEILKSSSLLLKGETSRSVKLHDIIRDVARSIAAKDPEYEFLFISGGSCLPNNVNYRTRKLLQFVDSDNFRFPSGMVCPDLHTLWLENNKKPQQFSNSFFEGILDLKILVLKGMPVFSERMPVQTFDNLSMLMLDGCTLNEKWLSSVPENLETLRVSRCGLPDPLDLSKLKYLRKLEVICDGEIEVVQNATSTLPPTLVELHIPGGFGICDAEGKRILVPNSSELNKLTALKSLNIMLEDSESCPHENIVANLRDFIIDVGDRLYSFHDLDKMRSVLFKSRCIEGGGEALVERAEEVVLIGVKGSVKGFSSSNRQAFTNLKKLTIYGCEEMEHVVEWKAENEIQQSQLRPSFSNLTFLFINHCGGLKYLFPASVGKCLVQLEHLTIINCDALEVVIKKESAIDDGMILNFPNLKELTLANLPSLRRFYGENRDANAASSSPAGSDCLFDEKIEFPALINLNIWWLKTSKIWGKNCYNNNSFSQLERLNIESCHNLEFVFPLAMLGTFQNLKALKIGYCHSMRYEVESSSSSCKSSNAELQQLIALRSIQFNKMPALAQTGLNSGRRNLYPNLETLYISFCHSLGNLFLPSTAKDLQHLKQLSVMDCKMMSWIIGETERKGVRIDEFVFPELTKLRLNVPNLKGLYFNESVEEHQSYLPTKVSFPRLELLELDVKDFKLDEIELSLNNRASGITKFVVKCDNKVQLPSKWQLQFPNTEELSLYNCKCDANICIFNNRCKEGGGKFLVETSEQVMLEDVKGSRNGFSNSNKNREKEPFSNMTKLSIQSCEGIEHLACIPRSEIDQSRPLTSFSKLTSLDIINCSGLKYLFTASVAKCLVELQRLVIQTCPTLEVVIRNDSTVDHVIIKFPKLELLTLWNLDSFQRFYGEDRGRSSSSTTIIENADISPDAYESPSDEMVSVPKVEILKFNIKGLPNCFSNSNIEALTKLKRLFIGSCEDREALTCTPQYQIQQSQPPTRFSELSKLYIHKCSGLKYLFCVSVAKCLLQLQELIINDCPALEVVIQNERAINGVIIEFAKLKTLALINLQSLRRLYGEKRGESSSSTTIMEDAVISSDESESLFNAMVALPALENLQILNLKTSEIWTKNCYADNSFGKLKSLRIEECCNLEFAIPLVMLPKFQKLKDLSICKCDSMSEIIRKEENEDELVFLELTGLYLKDLPNFKSFCLYEFGHQFHLATKVFFPKLMELEFYYVNTITLDEIELSRSDSTSELKKLDVRCHNEHQLPSKWQLQLRNIEELRLKNCMWHGSSGEHNVQQLLINPYGTPCFQSLKVVEVRNCGLSVVFSCSAFMNLHQLKKLKVKHCPLLEEVVREEENIVGTCENPVSLEKLEYIELNHLPKLKSFCRSANYAFNLPALKSIVLRKCPQMENFTFLEIRTPSMPDFNSQMEKYLTNPSEGNEEDCSDSESDNNQSFDESYLVKWFDAN